MVSKLVRTIRPFILSEVVTSQVYRNLAENPDNLLLSPTHRYSGIIPGNCPEAGKLFGLFGDDWDGKSNKFITNGEIKQWKDFLMVPNDDYNDYFALSSDERESTWELFRRRHSMGAFQKMVDEGVDHFKGDMRGERLLLCRRLSKIFLDDMFLNYADGRELEMLGSLERDMFYADWGQDGLKFNGQPNAYISQSEIDKEMKFLGITKQEFNQFYSLTYGERYLLLESRWYY